VESPTKKTRTSEGRKEIEEKIHKGTPEALYKFCIRDTEFEPLSSAIVFSTTFFIHRRMLHVLKLSGRQNAMNFTRADSRARRFIKSDVSEIDFFSIIRVEV
jgi:hypothetical protein